MLKLFKLGLSVNAACLLAGYINSKSKLNYEIESNELLSSKISISDFSAKLDKFNLEFPEYYKKDLSVSRNDNLNKLQKEKLDILVIGGGCSGAGVVLEGSQRGFKIGLIEGNDFASGTSSRSTKLIHGGIRYLQDVFTPRSGHQIEKFKLVLEALQERDFLINSCPYMNNVLEIKIPYKNIFVMDYYFMGVFVYHFLYAIQNFPSVINTFPWPRLYPESKLLSFFEGQMFDSRQCLLSILSSKNSLYTNYTLFKEYIYDTSGSGKIIGIKAYDKINNKEIEIYADCVVNCTGVFADTNLNKEDTLQGKLITASKGAHIIVKKELFKDIIINGKGGLMMPKTSDGRILFVLPYQREYYIIGTTDTETEKRENICAEEDDIKYLFNELKSGFNLSDENLKLNIKSQWAGLRPLVKSPSENNDTDISKSIARNHIIRVDNKSGLVSLLGGKWTTYRRMGEDALNDIEKHKLVNIKKDDIPNIPNIANITNGEYKSDLKFKLSGAVNFLNIKDKNLTYNEEREFYATLELHLINKYSIEENLARNLVFKYGLNSIKILDIDKANEYKSKFLNIETNSTVSNSNPILTAELIYAIKHEMVTKPNDFLCRRTGLAFVDFKAAEELIDKVSEIMASELKWSKDTLKKSKIEAKLNIKYLI